MKPLHVRIRQAEKAGHALEWIRPTPVAALAAAMFGRTIPPVPHFVRGGEYVVGLER